MPLWLSALIAQFLTTLASTLATAAIKRMEATQKSQLNDRAADERLERFNQAFKGAENDPAKIRSAISDFIRGV